MLKVARLDVISSGARRRWTLDEKQRIVAESYAAPRQVSATGGAGWPGMVASRKRTGRRRLHRYLLVTTVHDAVCRCRRNSLKLRI